MIAIDGQCYSFLHDLLKESTSLLNNYLSLGQFEQARSYALILKDKFPSYFIEFVNNIVQDGVPKEWTFSESVPTASHLIWLLYTEYKGVHNKSIDSNQLIRAEIDILLYTFSSIGVINKSTHKELLEIYRLLNLDVDITNIDISDETKTNLKSSLKTDPILASSLIFYFRKSDAPSQFKMHIIRQILDILIDVISEAIDQSNFELAFKLLKHLHADQQSLPETCQGLFKKIINLYFPYDTHNIRKEIYSSLLSLHHDQNYALTCFSSIEKEIYYRHSTSSNSNLPFPFQAFKNPTLKQSEAFSMFWNQYFNFITSSNQHFLEYIIIRFFELINDDNFEDIKVLLTPFEKLKPLLLLMAWNKCGNDIIFREKLIDALWLNNNSRSKNNLDLLDKCKELSNKIDLATWCAEHFVTYSEEISDLIGGAMTVFKNETHEFKISNSIYEMIDAYSIPYLIHPFFHKLCSEDICNLLHKICENDTNSLEADLTLTNAYFCLKNIIDLLDKCHNKDINQEMIKEYIDKSSDHLKLIKSFEAKIYLIECIFSLLFIQEKAWNVDNEDSFSSKNNERFVVTPIVAIKLLNYLKVSIETIILSNSDKINDIIMKTKSKIDEFVWRTNLIINHSYFLNENDDNIMTVLLASPKSLLIRSLKEQDFATSRDIIHFFKLSDEVSDIARIAELVETIHKSISQNKSFNIEELHPSLSKLQEFTIISDILTTTLNLKSKDYAIFLKKVKTLLEEFNELMDNKVFDRLQNYVNRIELLMSDSDSNYGPYLAYSYSQSLEHEELMKYLKLMNSLKDAVETLNIILYSSNSETINSEQLLKRVTLSLGEEVVGNNHDNLYLLNFLKQLLLIGMTLRDDQYIGNENFFDLLRASPTYLISDLVFKSGNFKKAEELSKDLDKHLESVILVSINSSKLKKRNEDEISTIQIDKKSINQKSKGMRRSTSLYSSLTSQSDFIIPGLPDDTRKYNLNMDIVEYLKKSSPIISILACILCSPSDYFDSRFLKYALSTSQKLYFPLFNWARIKARRFSLYYNTFLKENYDSLDFANDNSLNIENDDLEISRSHSNNKLSRINMSSSVLGSSYYMALGTPTASMGALGIGDEEYNPLAKLKLQGSPEGSDFDINYSTPNDIYSGSVEISLTPQITRSESKYSVDVSYFDLDNIDYIQDKDIQRDIESIFQSDYLEDEVEIYSKIVEKLISVGNIDKALDLADRMLPTGASDQLLRLIIKQNDGDESIWRIVMRLHDKTMASHLTLEYYTRWSPDIVLEVSEMCQYHLKQRNNDALLKKINDIHQKINLYKNILHIIPNKWQSWQELDSSCSDNLINVVNVLLTSKQYDIANSLAKMFGDAQLKRKIEEEYIIYLLTEKHDTDTVKKLLIEMGDDEDVQMAESLLEVINTNKDRLFLIQYLMDKKKSSHNNVYIHTLTTKELGVKILLCLSPELQKVYQHLISRPTSIIESLLMSEQTSVLAKIFAEVPQVRNDELVIKYAKKALSTSNITNENEVSSNIGSKKFYIADELKEHTYSSAPSYTLASNILDLCYNNQLAAHTCLTVCDNLSLKLIGLKDRLDIVKIMHQLIYYAKVRLTKDGNDENPNLLQLCDTLLGKTELLLQLIFSATPDIAKNLSLSSFADTQKVRILRDKLIEQDMLDLALLVANKCGIEAEPIWAAKGLQLLQVAMYQEAKQLFKLCMVSPHDDEDHHYRVNNLSGPKTPEDNVPLLNKIISVLESDVPLDTKNMAKKYNELNAMKNNPTLLKRFKAMDDANDEEDAIKAIESISKNKTDVQFKPRRKHTLDSNRYMQCVFYLQRYGTDELLMKFWLRHNLIEDALRHLMNKNTIDHKLFLSIIYHAISHNLFQRLKEAIMKIDPTLKKWREPLLNVCKELSAKKMYKLLIEFQVLMKDYTRAGLTCIKIFSQHEDYSMRMHYLNAAQKYFSVSLELESLVDNPISKSDVNKYIKTTRLQAKVTNFYHENAKEIIDPLPFEFSLFLPIEIKSKIAESIIVNHNFDLAFQIIQEYRLPASEIYLNAFKKMSKAKQTKKIEELIKNIKPFSSDIDIDICILTVIATYVDELNDIVAAKEFFPRMKTDALKCEALIYFRQLKEAYILAAKINDMRLVSMIKDVAMKYDMKREYELCEKFLSSRPQL